MAIALTGALASACAQGARPAPDDRAEALYDLGRRHSTGRGVPQDLEEAARYYREAAELGHAGAQVDLGYAYETGAGVARSFEEAARWYERAAEQEDPIAQSNLAYLLDHGQGVAPDLPRAVALYQAAAEQGVAPAQTNLGRFYAIGRGVPQDPERAARWYERAAEQGEPAAQHNLARMLRDGEGVAQDFERALVLFRASAEQEHPPAFTGVASMYARGLGVAQDPEEAVRWYRRAAERGDGHGRLELAKAYAKGEGVLRNLERAEVLYRAVHAGDPVLTPYAAYGLGELNETERDRPSAARLWYREAAQAGLPEAQHRLASLLLLGRGGAPDSERARYWLKQAAAQGYEPSRRALARLDQVERSDLDWYFELGLAQRAEQAGDPEAAVARVRATRARLEAQGVHDWRLGTARAVLADLIERYPEVAEGENPETLYRQAIEGLADGPGYQQLRHASAARKLALLLESEGRHAEAKEWTHRSHAVLRDTLPPGHPLWDAGGPEAVLREGRALGELIASDLGLRAP